MIATEPKIYREQPATLDIPYEPVHRLAGNPHFFYTSIKVKDALNEQAKEILTAARRALAGWVDVVSDRLGSMRCKIQNYDSFADSQPAKEDLVQHLEIDRIYFNSYKTVVNLAKEDITCVTQQKKDKEYQLLVLIDSNRKIQGIATLFVEANRLYVNTLLSAGWNVPMHADIASDHKRLKVTGVGKTLMHLVYKIAQATGKQSIELKPLHGSLTFYERLGMKRSVRSDGLYCSMPVEADGTPIAL